MDLATFLLTLGAVARLTRLITDDRLFGPVRVAAIKKLGVDHPVTYWLTCPWCVSPYVAGAGFTTGWFYGGTAPYFIATATLTASYLIGMAATHLDGRSDR
ncbi:hypothetical protein TPB0596_12360 [Tsukamurella pulmonis]|uniref:DUF1360 domain-containing protein n=1 Tax=Tsukamurella pulmonis TaxID=47312 RepID=UPI001EDE8099|nr:DUF1360 domain-containing protein [Tsukamurella pulmonis]BDD81473.1 hypothetical protein TPB0596_12360 [Tsukamurella pulmonis]